MGQNGDAAVAPKIIVEDLRVGYGATEALKGVSLSVYPNEILGVTGPSSSGKTTLLRMLNRLNDRVRSCHHEGRILLDGQDIHAANADVHALRRRVGIVFALPTPLPKTVFENVVYGLRIAGVRDARVLRERAEQALLDAVLWDEVRDRLDEPALRLSGGQQQRLCIARTLAQAPEVVMLDEPCSGLDPISTLKIEQALQGLKSRYTIILVSHNTQQAARATDRCAFLLMGELVEWRLTRDMFTGPADPRTSDFLEGRLG